MSRIEVPFVYAGIFVAVLLAATPNPAQKIVRSAEPTQSIVSLSPSPHPQGDLLAHHPGDATFQHAPANYHVFAAATVGKDAGVEALALNFADATRLTRIELKNKEFVIEPGGTCHEGNSYVRGDSCTLLVRFNPQGPGHRMGFITVANSAEGSPMSLGLTGNGYAPVVSFTPSQITTVAASVSAGTGTIKSATNLAIDGGDILYIADTGNNKLKEMDSTGAIILPPTTPIATPVSVAADSFGNVYTANVHGGTYYFSIYYPWGSQTAYGYAYVASSCTVSAPCTFSAVGMSYPANVSIDANNNLFFEEGNQGAAEMPVGIVSGGSDAFKLWHLSDQFSYASGAPASFAVDASGNLYTNYTRADTGTCYLLQEPLYNAEHSPTAIRVAGGVACGFAGDGGQARSAEISSNIGQMAFDVAGNLYFADTGNQRVRRIDAVTGIISTIAGNGTAGYSGDGGAAIAAQLSNPTGVAVDSLGQVYILSNAPSAGPTQVLRKVTTVGYRNFGNQLRSTVSAARVFTVANTGNDTLTLSANAMWTGANPGDFSIDPTTTNCVLTAGATLPAGHSCKIGILFKPAAAGFRSATLLLSDNTVSGFNTIQLMGTGTLPAPTMKITSPTAGGSAAKGTNETFAVSVTSASGPQPTGTVTFKVNGNVIGSPVTLSNTGTASKTFTETTAASYTLLAVYNGDSNYSTASASESFTFSIVAKLPVSVMLTPSVRPLAGCGGVSFSARVTSSGGASPSGQVELLSGSGSLASASLSGGAALLQPHRLAPGKYAFTARYAGDNTHQPAISAPVPLTVPPAEPSCGSTNRPAQIVQSGPTKKP